jgi:PAS domain S-box-containing protein
MVLKRLKSVEPTVKALRIAELRYQSLFMAARDAILILDRKSGIIVDANEQSEQLLQRTSKDIVGMHSSQLRIQDEVENFQQTIINQIELDNPPLIELEIKNLDGRIIPVEINASEIQMGGQNLIQCILRDITERKIIEKRLKDSENKFRHLFTSSPFSIILLNPKGVVVDCNPAVEQLLGYKKEELIDKRFDRLSLLRPKYLEMLLESLRTVIKEDSITLLEVKLTKKNGESLWANVQATQVVICKDSFIQIIANNITEQKKAEKALRESEFQFHKAYDRANFYKELFAQEVNNIFNKIQSSIERFNQDKKDSGVLKEITEILELIEDQSVMGTKLVSNVRKLALIEDTRFSMVKIEINSLLQKAINQIQEIYQDKELDIKIYPPNKKFYVHANEILTDVFENILINVIEYNKNPKIDIQILIYRRFKDDIDYLKMEFIDKEIGTYVVKNEFLEQKSEVQYKRSRGMLLGLSFVDQILNSINGEIWVEGTNFVLTIPEAK